MPLLLYDVKDKGSDATGQIIWGDAFEALDDLKEESVDLIVTSPPPFLTFTRFVVQGQRMLDPRTLGMEVDTDMYISHLVAICSKMKRVLKKTGSLWIHIADSDDFYTNMMRGIPERFFVQMITKPTPAAAPWYPPEKPIWHRTEKSVRKNERHLKRNYEHFYHFVKDPDLYRFNERGHSFGNSSVLSYPFDYTREQSKNVESGFPEELIEVAIRTCLTPNMETEVVMDPFGGTGTTGLVAMQMHKSWIMMDIFERRCHAMAGRLFK